jgi:hypothetical protein
MRISLASVAFFLSLYSAAYGAESKADIKAALTGIGSTDQAAVQRSVESLRQAGPDGLHVLLNQYDRHPDPKLIPAIDAVAAQRGALVSRLFWYTDLSQAESAAKEQGKPILYLRLMGKLTDEYSCANSRFFRTVLYSNRQVSAMLRDRFVLVWCSERPVPVITIDYGDGRLLKRTITGNSIHYILDSQGQVVDALPGLFDPSTFQRVLNAAIWTTRADERGRRKYLDRADNVILEQWKRDVAIVAPQVIPADLWAQSDASKAQAPQAMRLTVSKMLVEAPMLRAISPDFAAALDQSIDNLDEKTWQKIASLHAGDATLDDQSIAVIRSQNPVAYADPAALDRTVQQFQRTIAEDSVRDNYQLRRQVLAWLRQSPTPVAVDDLNSRVYSELFLTPRNDPWLGLAPQGVYTALTEDGCCAPATR